ncbi:hypothetical protein V8E53_010020 [Lactarius tabidus]
MAKELTLFLYLRRQGSTPPTATDLAREVKRNEAEGSSRVVHSDQDGPSQGKDTDLSADLDPDSDLDQDLDHAWDRDEPLAWSTVKVRAKVGRYKPGCKPHVRSTTPNSIQNVQNEDGPQHEAQDAQGLAQGRVQKPWDRPQVMPAQTGCHKGWLLLDRLCVELGHVCEVLEDSNDSELLGYSRGAAVSICTDVPQDELWENVNPGLDRILGFGRLQDEIVAMIQCGQKGLQGLYKYFEVLIEQGGIVGGLLEGKIDALMTAMAVLRQPGVDTTQGPAPNPLPIPGTCKLPIEVIERSNRTKIPDERMLTWEQSMCAPKPMTRTCSGVYLAMPNSVPPFSAYPFMLHEQFALPWDIHIVDHQMSIQLIKCTGIWERSSDSCQACSQLLTHQIVEAILCWIKDGIHVNTNYAYQPIGGLIEILRKKSAMLNGLHFKQLSMS